jgi:N-acylglucosamine-6-phosphate 2-epimerase
MSDSKALRFSVEELRAALSGGLIVSCQASEEESLFGAEIMAKMAIAAVQGGAVAIRANSPVDIAAIRRVVSVPIIGLWKRDLPGYAVRITPRLDDALALVDAGADIIALDATARPHPEGSATDLIASVVARTRVPILADVAAASEAAAAVEAGAAFAASTLSGYLGGTVPSEPDLDLVAAISEQVGRERTIAEGRYRTGAQVAAALRAGALAVCVGGAITRPAEITRRVIDDLRSS